MKQRISFRLGNVRKHKNARIKHFFTSGILFVLVIGFTCGNMPIAFSYTFEPVTVNKINVLPYGYEITVYNETFYVEGLMNNTWNNFTWKDINNKSHQYMPSWYKDLEIIPVLRDDFNLTAWNEHPVVYLPELHLPSCGDLLGNDSHALLAKYNGTYFEELIVYGYNSLICYNIYGDRWNYTEHELYDFIEYNHSVIANVSTVASIYNPTYAMYMTKLYLMRHYPNLNKSSVLFKYAFLIPSSLLPEQYSNYTFLWVLDVRSDVTSNNQISMIPRSDNYQNLISLEDSTKAMDLLNPYGTENEGDDKLCGYISFILMDLNGNVVLDATKGIKYLPPPCGNSCNPEYRFIVLVEVLVAISAIIVLSVVIVVKIKRRKEKGRKKT